MVTVASFHLFAVVEAAKKFSKGSPRLIATIALVLQKTGRCAWIRVVNKVLHTIDVQEGDNETVSSNLWICGNCQKWFLYKWQALECVGVSGVCIIASRC